MRTSMIRRGLCWFLVVFFLMTGLSQAKTPLAILKQKQKEVTTLLDQYKAAKTPAGKRAIEKKMELLLKPLVDIRLVGQMALKSHWKTLNKPQQEEYLFWLEALIRESYQRSINNTKVTKGVNKGQGEVKFLRQVIKGRSARVYSQVRYRKNKRRRWKKVRIDWSFRKRKGKWLVADMLTNDNSLVETYNEQFTKLINKKSFKGLLDVLRKKVNQLRKDKKLAPLKYKAAAAPKAARRCKKGRKWVCVRRCLKRKRVKGRRRCVRYSRKKKCSCRRVRRRR